jgi:hypothetical protein
MDYQYYRDRLKELEGLTHLSCEKQESFFQRILFASSSILGILVALHTEHPESLCIRLVFVSAILLLSLGALTAGTVLYDYSKIPERTRQEFYSEFESALRELREMNAAVSSEKKKRTLFCEKCSLFFLPVSLILLAAYAILITF